ncbi:MAG TPA: mannose-1-phosphate guanylyltransferase/mannose-6-phosphate isomerase [Cyanobacteria bacterium UBA9971]|nr:mannose-1-phosphate guanylyltransferase/mannose-6-phosphate isomerase [Cyanobacteria bacterium UBA9971]
MNDNKNIFGVILAGGSGSRLWPLSREMYPKQLLKLTGENSLFQSTFLRLTDIIPAKNIITVTNDLHLNEINIQLKEINQNHRHATIGEPVGRNTAPAIGLSALFIQNNLAEENSDPVIFVTPSDHLIQDNEAFLDAVREGIKLAEDGYIVTFGIKPSKPETGYGYIKTNKDLRLPRQPLGLPRNDNFIGYKVEEFKEKPDFETAKRYLEAGNYFWNSGIFMFKASTILKEMQIHSPDVLAGLNKLDLIKDFIEKEDYQAIPSISIDYAVMEKSDRIALIPVDCGWNDLGSWESIYDVMDKDTNNNYTKGNIIAIETEDSYIYSSSKLVSTIGVKNLVIIETEDAILVCDKSRTQDVKIIFDKLKKENKKEI